MKKLISLLKKLKRHLPKLAVIIAIAGLSTAGVTYAQFARQTGSIGWGYGYGYGYGLGYGWDSGLSAGYRNVVEGDSGWEYVGLNQFSTNVTAYHTIDFNTEDVPYVAYLQGAGTEIVVQYFNSGSLAWVDLPDIEFTTTADAVAFAIFEDTPYIAYSDDGNGGGSIVVMSYDGSDWNLVGPAYFVAGQVDNISLAFDSTGVPYVAYQDELFSDKTSVQKFVSGAWYYVGSTFISGQAEYQRIALDSNDVPYVAYIDYDNGQEVTVKKYNGSSWETVGLTGFTDTSVAYLDLVIGSDNQPYVLYNNFINGSRAAVMKYDGSSWGYVGGNGFSQVSSSYHSLAIDSDDNLYAAYSDSQESNRISVMKYDGSSWDYVDEAGISEGSATWPSVNINSSNVPYVSYADDADLAGKTSVKTYLTTESSTPGNQYAYGYGYGYMNPSYISSSQISWDSSFEAYRITSSAVGQPIVNAGILIPNTSNSASSTSAEFMFKVTAASDGLHGFLLNQGTTLVTGGSFDLADLSFTDISSASISGQDFLGGFNFGLSEDMTSSESINLYIYVGSQYDGETLNVYHQSPSDLDWSLLTTCEVGNSVAVPSGYCYFSATSFSSFAATTPTTTEETGGGSNSGSGGGGYPDGYFDDVSDPNTDPAPEEETSSTQEPQTCLPYINSYIKLNTNNNSEDVTKLETFLNTYEGESLSVNGIYEIPDYQAVIRFQEKYFDEVLTPWGFLTKGTGYVHKTTKAQINKLHCESQGLTWEEDVFINTETIIKDVVPKKPKVNVKEEPKQVEEIKEPIAIDDLPLIQVIEKEPEPVIQKPAPQTVQPEPVNQCNKGRFLCWLCNIFTSLFK